MTLIWLRLGDEARALGLYIVSCVILTWIRSLLALEQPIDECFAKLSEVGFHEGRRGKCSHSDIDVHTVLIWLVRFAQDQDEYAYLPFASW